jgi:hypothetical protein
MVLAPKRMDMKEIPLTNDNHFLACCLSLPTIKQERTLSLRKEREGCHYGAKITLLPPLSSPPSLPSPITSMTTFTTASFLAIFLLICSTFNPHSTLVHAQDDLTDADNQLFEASANEDTDAALAALKAGANINARSKGGLQTPLMQSVLFGREKMVKFFLEQGADV